MRSVSDLVFRPFERLVRPFELPVTPPPAMNEGGGPFALFWHFARMFKGVLAVVGVISVVNALVSLVVVWALATVVDGVVREGAATFVSENAALLWGLFVLFAVIDPLLVFVRQAFMSQTVQVLLPAAMRWQSHKAVERQDVAFFEDVFAGQVASRIGQVVGAVQRQMMVAMQIVPRTLIQFGGSFALLAVLAWPLAIPVLVWIVANALVAWVAVPIYARRSKKVAAATSRATGAMTDVYSNIAMVKLFAAEDSEAGAIRRVIGETIETQHTENRAYIVTDTGVQLGNALLLVSLFAVGLWGLLDGFVTIGEFVAAATVSRQLAGSSHAFIGLGQSVSRAWGTIADAMPIITTAPTVTDAADAKTLDVREGRIAFSDVSFAYATSERVVDGLSLRVEPGEKVGIVGLSGAGKSTLIALLMRLRDVTGGAIRIDGVDVRAVTQTSLRESVAVVTQDVGLLHRSIRDNVRYGRPDATDEEVEAAVRAANAWDFVSTLRDAKGRTGLDAHVGDRGVKLSGGQRQRITLARAILKDAPILVLDEATSALDSEAEAAIQMELARLMEGKTVLAVAHRLSTIAAMDRIVVMDAGRIVEAGTHDELLAGGGLYARLWARQSGGFLAVEQAEAA